MDTLKLAEELERLARILKNNILVNEELMATIANRLAILASKIEDEYHLR